MMRYSYFRRLGRISGKGVNWKDAICIVVCLFIILCILLFILPCSAQLSGNAAFSGNGAFGAITPNKSADVYILANANSGLATTTNDLWAATDLGSSGLGAWRFDYSGGFHLTQTPLTNTSTLGKGLPSTINVIGGSSHADQASTWGWFIDLSVNPTADAEILFTNATKPAWISVLYAFKTDCTGLTGKLLDTVTIHPSAPETWAGTVQYQDGYGTPHTNGVVVHGGSGTNVNASGSIFETNTTVYYHVLTFGNTNAGSAETLSVYSNDVDHTLVGFQTLPITNGLKWSYLQLMGSANNHAAFPANKLFYGGFAIRVNASAAGTVFKSADIREIFGDRFQSMQASGDMRLRGPGEVVFIRELQ